MDTVDTAFLAPEVTLNPKRRRQSYSREQKLRIVQETLKPGASVSVVARRHDVNANLVFTWRRHHQQGALVTAPRKPRKPKLLPVIVQPDKTELGPRESNLAQREVLAAPTGRIEIKFPGGGTSCRWDGRCGYLACGDPGAVAAMMPAGARIWLVAGVTDLRRRIDGLCALVQTALCEDPFAGHVFIFRGRRGDKVKILWHETDGRAVPVLQATASWLFCLATGPQRYRATDECAVIDAAGRHRLETT